MKKIVQNAKGFTLVELMIVVAIIGILAAIAIPQFAAYRMRGYNSSAMSDVKNLNTTEAAMFADWQRYGTTQSNAGTFTPATPAAGVAVPVAAGDSSGIATADFTGNTQGIAISVSNGVSVLALTNVVPAAAAAGNAAAFVAAGKHVNGDSTFGVDSDSPKFYSTSTIVSGEPAKAVGTILTTALFTASVSANTVETDDFSTVTKWSAK